MNELNVSMQQVTPQLEFAPHCTLRNVLIGKVYPWYR
jgi:hypothetical protein